MHLIPVSKHFCISPEMLVMCVLEFQEKRNHYSKIPSFVPGATIWETLFHATIWETYAERFRIVECVPLSRNICCICMP